MLITADKMGFVTAVDLLSDPAAFRFRMTKTRSWSEMPRSEMHSTKVSKVYSSPGTSIGTRIKFLAILKERKSDQNNETKVDQEMML